MLDTVGIKHFYHSLVCDGFKDRWQYLSRSKNPTWILNRKGVEILPKLTMIYTPNGIWHLSAQVCLPKMLFGHNAKLPNQDEVNHGLKMMSEYVEAESGLPFDTASATVSLIHYACDVHLPESEVLPTLYRLSDKNLRYTDKLLYNDLTLYFQTKSKKRLIRIYPKLNEVLSRKDATAEAIESAKGVLRFEHCFLQSGIIGSFVKRNSLPDKTTKSLLNEDVSRSAISEVFEGLDFFGTLRNDKSNLDILLEKYPTRKAMMLNSFLEMVNRYGENFYKIESLKFSKDCYYSDARFCRKAKVWKRRKSLE